MPKAWSLSAESSCFETYVSDNGAACDDFTPLKQKGENKLTQMTKHIADVYKTCNPQYSPQFCIPQRVLTIPSEGVLNNGMDNAESNLVCHVYTEIECNSKKEKCTYTVLDLLGTGTFGQVFRCMKTGSKEFFAVKVIRNKPAYQKQGLCEIAVLELLNNKYDPDDKHHLVRLKDSFQYKGHICLVFELLSMTLLDILTQNQFRGLPLPMVQRFTRQILSALLTLEEANIIHCDLKPENILAVPHTTATVTTTTATTTTTTSQQQPGTKTPPSSTSSSSSSSLNPNTEATTGTTETAVITDSTPIPVPQPPPSHPAGEGAGTEGETGTTPTAAVGVGVGVAAAEKERDNKNKQKATSPLSDIKVIDFGSACFEGNIQYAYIQSRFCK